MGSTDGDLYLLDATGRVLTKNRLAEGGTQASAALDAPGRRRGKRAAASTPSGSTYEVPAHSRLALSRPGTLSGRRQPPLPAARQRARSPPLRAGLPAPRRGTATAPGPALRGGLLRRLLGLSFPDASREKELPQGPRSQERPPPRRPRAGPRASRRPARVRAPGPGSVGIIIDYAHSLAPSGPTSAVERQNITTLARWATEPRVAARRPLVFLIAPSVGRGLATRSTRAASGAEVVRVPKPGARGASRFLRARRERYSDLRLGAHSGRARGRDRRPGPRPDRGHPPAGSRDEGAASRVRTS